MEIKKEWTDWESLNDDELQKAIKEAFYSGKSWLDEE